MSITTPSKIKVVLMIAVAVLGFGSLAAFAQQPTGKQLGLRTVVIDPGHGGKDPGALGQTSSSHEKHVVLAISKLLGDMIKEAYPDVKVVYTRSSDTFIGLHDRAMVARKNNADLSYPSIATAAAISQHTEVQSTFSVRDLTGKATQQIILNVICLLHSVRMR